MNRDSTGTDAAGAIDLAREPPFALAHLTVTPAALRVESGAWAQRLEPRAMQVLVVLARAAPEVVGRAELNLRVWGGRVVGEDAINRAVQTLRRIAAEAPPPTPFRIQTVPRVGYRLTTGGAAPGARMRGGGRRLWLAALVIPVLVLAALLAWRSWRLGAHGASMGWTIASSTALDDLPAGASDAALSPDGRRLAYRAVDARHHGRIWVRAAGDGGAGAPVSPAGVDARRIAWSPDSASLAFSSFDFGRPCRLYVVRVGGGAAQVGACETTRDARLAWGADGRSLLFGDAPGENAVQRITAVRLADGLRTVLTSPPGDSMGDALPATRGGRIVFQRQFGWADEGWIERDLATGRERLLWRRRGVAGSVGALLPDGALAVAWTRAGASELDLIGTGGRARSEPVAFGPITAMSVAGRRLLLESDRIENTLVRAGDRGTAALASVHGRISGPMLLADGRLRFPVTAAGVARVWESDAAGALRPWGAFVATRLAGLAPSPDGRFVAALATGDAGREIVLFDAAGRLAYRWNPHARSVNAAAWSADGRTLVAPILDGAGWRLFGLDPFGRAAPRELGLPGFAVVMNQGGALYAVRAGETTGVRELWRLDGGPRRLPVDLTLFDIINWRPVADGVWLPDRADPDHPRLALRDAATGRLRRSVAAPGLTGAGSGLAANARGPVYVQAGRDAPEYSWLTLARTDWRD